MSLVELDAVQIRIRIAVLKVAHVIKFIAFDLNDTRQEISVKYTEQIISILNKAGYVSSSRGFQGGYRLTKPLNEYVIGDILRLTEGSLAPVECLATAENPCPKQQKCATIMLWEKVDKAIRDVVDHVTLQDLLDWQKQERC